MELNIQKQGCDQNEDIKRMTYAKPWHMSHIHVEGRLDKKSERSEGPRQSGPIQAVPEGSVRCHQGISAQDHNIFPPSSRTFQSIFR